MRKVNSERKRRKEKNKSGCGKGCVIFVAVFFITLIAVVSYIVVNVIDGLEKGEDPIASIVETFAPTPPERTIFLVVGVDKQETLTDTIMLMCFNAKTNKLDIISIPRDTKIEVDGQTKKINSVNGYYGGGEDGIFALSACLEKMLDIKIDYYIKISCDAFKNIVDGIGGIEFDVPMRMKYSDPAQDLFIDLQEGVQLLNGEQAEGLVRFRKGYERADLQRVEVQRDFIKVFLKTALSKENIIKNPTAYINTFFNDIETDFSLKDDLPAYIASFINFNAENVTGYTLEGDGKYIGGISYFIPDKTKNKKLVYDIFKKEDIISTDDTEQCDSHESTIQILNAGNINGLAGKTKELLETDGYTIDEIGNFDGESIDDTIIYVNKDNIGYDLKKYFKNAEVIKDEEATMYYDIVIIVGSNDADISEEA